MKKFTLMAVLLLCGVTAFSQSLEFVNKNGEIISNNSTITVTTKGPLGMDAEIFVKNTGNSELTGSLMLSVRKAEGGQASYCGFGMGTCRLVNVGKSEEGTTSIESGQTIDPEIHFMVSGDKAYGEVEYKLTYASEEKKVTIIYSYDAANISTTNSNNFVNAYQRGDVAELVYNFESDANRQLNVYNVTGKLVASDKIFGTDGKLALALEKGLYIYSVSENGKVVATHKFIVR